MRHRYKHISRPSSSERSSLGDTNVEAAIGRLKTIQQKSVATMTSFHGSIHSVISLLFDPDTIERAERARGIVKPQTTVIEYDMGHNVALTLDYEASKVPAIQPNNLKLQPGFMSIVDTYINEVRAVHMQYEELKGVVRWLNRNATPGAIRYLFPQAMKLVPDSPIWKDLQAVPSRYSQPDDIAAWTQPIKDAANTFVAVALLPEDAKPRGRDRHMWLTFKPTKVHLDVTDPNKTHYTTDEIVYNF